MQPTVSQVPLHRFTGWFHEIKSLCGFSFTGFTSCHDRRVDSKVRKVTATKFEGAKGDSVRRQAMNFRRFAADKPPRTPPRREGQNSYPNGGRFEPGPCETAGNS